MKSFFYKGLLVLCFVFAFVATSMADDNTTANSEPEMYRVDINYEWYYGGGACYMYSDPIFATEVNTGEEYSMEYRSGNDVIYVPAGEYHFHGNSQYWWGVVSLEVEIDCDTTITMKIWSE